METTDGQVKKIFGYQKFQWWIIFSGVVDKRFLIQKFQTLSDCSYKLISEIYLDIPAPRLFKDMNLFTFQLSASSNYF